MPRGRPWTKLDDADLTRMYCVECMSLAIISRQVKRSEDNVRKQVAKLKLVRDENAYAQKWAERREAGKARAFVGTEYFSPPEPNRTEEHAVKCIGQGGFKSFGEVYLKSGPGPSSISPSREWRLLPIGQAGGALQVAAE